MHVFDIRFSRCFRKCPSTLYGEHFFVFGRQLLKIYFLRDTVSHVISALLTLPLTVLCGLFERFCPKIFVNISWRVDCTVLVTVAVPVLPCTTLLSAISTAVEQYSVFKVLPKMSLYFLWGEISRFWFVNFLLHFLARGTVSRDTSHCTLGNFFVICSMFLYEFISFSQFTYTTGETKKRRTKSN